MLKLKQAPRRTVDILFILTVLTVFSTIAFLLLFLGAEHYQSIVNRMAVNNEIRTTATYLKEKINQNDVSGSFSIANIGNSDAIALTETVMEQTYTTYIYVYDGYLREIYVSRDSTFLPKDGQPIIEAADFHISEISENLYECSFSGASMDNSVDNSRCTSLETSIDNFTGTSMVTGTIYLSLNAEP